MCDFGPIWREMRGDHRERVYLLVLGEQLLVSRIAAILLRYMRLDSLQELDDAVVAEIVGQRDAPYGGHSLYSLCVNAQGGGGALRCRTTAALPSNITLRSHHAP